MADDMTPEEYDLRLQISENWGNDDPFLKLGSASGLPRERMLRAIKAGADALHDSAALKARLALIEKAVSEAHHLYDKCQWTEGTDCLRCRYERGEFR